MLKIERDKILHFGYSLFGSFLISIIIDIILNFNNFFNGVIGFSIMFIIGLYKEFIHDKLQKKGVFQLYDILANFLGCLFGFILYNVILLFV